MNQTPATPFAIRNLSILAYAMGFSLWHYKARTISLAQVQCAGFFDDAVDQFAVGDMIHISASDGGCILFVASVADGVKVRVMAST